MDALRHGYRWTSTPIDVPPINLLETSSKRDKILDFSFGNRKPCWDDIRREPRVGISLTREDLDPRIRCDSQIQPIEETRSLELALGRTIQLDSGLSNNDQIIIESTLKDNTDLFAWSVTDLSRVAPGGCPPFVNF